MKQTTTTRAMINAAINALCAGANDRIKFAPVEKGYQFDRVIVAVYHKGARKPFNTALVMVDTFRGIVHTANMIVVAPECMDAYRDVKAVKITAADVAEFVEPASEQEQEAPAETEQATEDATPATTTAPTDAAELDSLKAIRDDITTDPNPDTIRAAQDAIKRHFIEIDPEDIDTPRKIRAALTDIINAIYWDIAEDITPATTATETAAPLQLETLAARLDRMTAAELVELYAATSAPGSVDDETDSAIYDALRASNPRAYRVWMKTSVEYNPGDPASIEAANAADVERLRAAYGVTA